MIKTSYDPLLLGNNITIGVDVVFGTGVIIYDNVHIGDKSHIGDYVILGEATIDYYSNQNYKRPPTTIGRNALIRSHSIIYAGAKIGYDVHTGNRATIREGTDIGNHCSIGLNSDIQPNCTIGDYTRLHSNVIVGQGTTIGKFVFVYPFCVLTNDPLPPSLHLKGSVIGDFCQISASTIIMPEAHIGAHSLISANSRVSGVFDADSFIEGTPARCVGKLSKMPFFNENGKRHYPWPLHFDRGMPWANLGFEAWAEGEGISII